jgi:hypothetical protein
MRIPRFGLRWFVVVLVVLAIYGTSNCFAQSDSASISGRVTDPSGAIVHGVEIQLQSADRGTNQTTVTNENGIYVFPFVQPGIYNVTIRKSGFQQLDYVGLTANTQDHIEQNFKLSLGAASESVTVSAEGNHIETSGVTATSVDQEMVQDMPLNGQTFQSLIGITPGATRTSGSGLFSFNGQRDNSNYFTVDGVSANVGVNQIQGAALGQAGAGQAPSLSAIGTTSGMLPLDAVQEIKIQTSSYAAEFGRSAGGQIAITSRSGGNQYHGSLYDNIRNDALDAMNSYTKWENAELDSGFKKPELRVNLFGGTLGGPVEVPGLYNGKNKTFFFVSYEGLRMRQPTSGYADVPSPTVRAGTLASGVNIYPGLLPYIDMAPLPNGLDIYGQPAHFASYSNPTSTNSTSVRIDEKLGDRVTLFGRVGYAPSNKNIRSIYSINEVDSTTAVNKVVTVGANIVFTPHFVNEFHANWTKSSGDSNSTLDSFGGSTVPTAAMYSEMFPAQYGASMKNSMFVFGAYGGDLTGTSWGTAWQVGNIVANTQRQINLIDDIDWLKGKHAFKFGVDWRYLFPIAAPQVYSPLISYYSDEDMASGSATVGQVISNDVVVVHQFDTALFAQDTWHVTPRLTLDYGIRWDYDPAPHAVDGQSLYVASNPLDPANLTLSPAGTSLYPAIKTQFVPRVGGSYEFWDKPGWESMLRGGFGLFYVPSSDTALQATNYYPHQRYTALFGTNWMTSPLPPVTLAGAIGQPPYSNQYVLGYYPGFTTPRTYGWNVAIQQALGSSQNLTVGYVGAAGRHLTRQSQFSGSNFNDRFLDLDLFGSQDSSDYHALQISYLRRVRKGLMVLANYTWSKSLDTASSDSTIAPSPSDVNIAAERGLSSFDVRNAFNASVHYDIPTVPTTNKITRAALGGWSIGGIYMAHSGSPLTVSMTDVLPSGSTASVRPDVTSQPKWINNSKDFGGRVLNPAAFDYSFLNGSGRLQGNEPRGFISGPGFSELEFTAKRQIKITDRVELQYSAELFNLLNQTNYAAPNTNLGSVYQSGGTYKLSRSTTFGEIQNTLNNTTGGGFFGVGGARSIQMALRLQF